MKATKISMLLAIIVGMGMMLCGSASAFDNQTLEIYFECQAKGKGYNYSTDNASAEDLMLSESKDKLPKNITFYLRVDRIGGEVEVVYYDADNESWKSDYEFDEGGGAIKTDAGFLVMLSSIIYNSEDNILVMVMSYARAQLNEKDDELKSAKFQSIGGLYIAGNDTEESGSMGVGSPKLKGKLIAWDDLPADVQIAFEPKGVPDVN